MSIEFASQKCFAALYVAKC